MFKIPKVPAVYFPPSSFILINGDYSGILSHFDN